MGTITFENTNEIGDSIKNTYQINISKDKFESIQEHLNKILEVNIFDAITQQTPIPVESMDKLAQICGVGILSYFEPIVSEPVVVDGRLDTLKFWQITRVDVKVIANIYQILIQKIIPHFQIVHHESTFSIGGVTMGKVSLSE